jgi:hypothetical protein
MPATVKCVITLPNAIDPLILGIHTIDAQSATVQTNGNTMTVSQDNVIVEDGYNVHIILYGSPGYALTMDIFVDNAIQNAKPISPTYNSANNAYEFLYIQD